MKFLYLIFVFNIVDLSFQNECIKKETCRECIRQTGCSWCTQQNVQRKCFETKFENQCDKNSIYNPKNEFNVLKSSNFDEDDTKLNQLEPEEIKIKLRKNDAYKIKIKFKQYTNVPLDLYYLMDISNSMEDDKDKLSAIGNTLVESMKNITSAFRLGFGTFVDKVVMPYVSIVPKKLEEPCNNCAAPYGFRNHMPLSHDTHKFSGQVNDAKISGNLDDPEGGFDAIMQSIVCKDEIGWSQFSRKVLVFATDSLFHYAGDGKLGGIVKPNDCQCHLDEKGYYNYTVVQDYPTLYELNNVIKNNAINVIFAATADRKSLYYELSKHIEGSSVGELSSDSSNIIELINEEYHKIASSIIMKETSSNNVKIDFYTKCRDENGPLINTNRCDGLKGSELVEFEAEVKVLSCPDDKEKWSEVFQIYPVGINESITINLEMICACPCENDQNEGFKPDAAECTFRGDLKCGKCECDENYFGNRCECDSRALKQDDEFVTGCRPDNTTLIKCSSRGSCICGQCYCDIMPNADEHIYGQFCECDNFSCDRVNSLLCSGPGKGICDCGACKCEEGWSGKDCSCSTSIETCRDDGGNICSGRGECICGKCSCEESYVGKYCEKSAYAQRYCTKLQECVTCEVHKTEGNCENSCVIEHKNDMINSTFEIVPLIEVNDTLDEQLCTYYEEDCRIYFSYYHDKEENLMRLKSQKEKDCPQNAPFYAGIIILPALFVFIAGIGFIGLWKFATHIADKREWERFNAESKLYRSKLVENQNPLYQGPISHYKNPLYEEKYD